MVVFVGVLEFRFFFVCVFIYFFFSCFSHVSTRFVFFETDNFPKVMVTWPSVIMKKRPAEAEAKRLWFFGEAQHVNIIHSTNYTESVIVIVYGIVYAFHRMNTWLLLRAHVCEDSF